MNRFRYINTTRLSADREVKRALDIINKEIQNGSLVYIYELDNRNWGVKLKNPIGIAVAEFPEIDDPYYDNCPQYVKGPATALLSGSED